MATAKAAPTILNVYFECSVCNEVFQDPRMLPCGHTFCLRCLQNIAHAADVNTSNATAGKMIPCPQCRRRLPVGQQNLQDLPKNYAVANFILSQSVNSQCEQAVQYETHPNKKIMFYCETCQRFAYSQVLAKTRVQSAKHKSNFTLKSMNSRTVDILSVSSEGQLLVGQWYDCQLHVYSADCSHVMSIKLPNNDTACDAVWTPRGNIIYSNRSGKVLTVSRSGDVIQLSDVLNPTYFSVSTDDVIYLISDDTSVYQSTDDGLTWSRVFNVSDGWKCFQVIKVLTDSNADVFWTIVMLAGDKRLRVYTVDKRRALSDNVTWRNVTLPDHVTIDLWFNRLAYDGRTSIFVTDCNTRTVHVWSVSGQYDRQLVSRDQRSFSPQCAAVDIQRDVMYVGKDKGTVGVFELTYETL